MTTKRESRDSGSGEFIKTDVLGRVRVKSADRERMSDAFEKSGMSGAAFAREHGVKQ